MTDVCSIGFQDKVNVKVKVDNGKYEFCVEDGIVSCTRHGEPWLVFEKGSKALVSLIFELIDLRMNDDTNDSSP